MKVFVIKSTDSKSGYALRTVNDDGTAEVKPVDFWSAGKTNPRYKDTLLLPKNSANRTYFDIKQFEKKGVDEVELEYRETRILGPYNRGVVKQDWTFYMTADEKVKYDEIKAACMTRKTIAEKPPELTEAEKLQLEIEKLTAKLAALNEKK